MELTDEQRADIQEREKQFISEYQALTEKHQMDFASFPGFVPIGQGAWAIMVNAQVKDKKYLSPISPLQP